MTTPLENIKAVDRGVMLRLVDQIQSASEGPAMRVKGNFGNLLAEWEKYQARYIETPTDETVAINNVVDAAYKAFEYLTLDTAKHTAGMLGNHIKSLAPKPSKIDVKVKVDASEFEKFIKPLESWAKFHAGLNNLSRR